MTRYDPKVEKLNIISHGIGLVLSIIALPLLILRASDGSLTILSAVLYGVSAVILYAASTVYHSTEKEDWRDTMETIDHASIFILIAGSYTPFALIVLKGSVGWILFGLAWGFAFIGVLFKFISEGHYKKISVVLYVLMGLMALIFIDPIIYSLKTAALIWLAVGGVFFLTGAALYGFKPIKYNHAVFHTLVLLGSISHFAAVYFYILI